MKNPNESTGPQSPRFNVHQHRFQNWVFLGAILAAVAVGLGAFGAHGLDGILAERHNGDPELLARRIDNWETAALYQMHHSVGLILVGLVAFVRPGKWLTIAGWCFLIGILVFSGMLYALVLTEVRVLGAIVPIGGVAYLLGWLALAMGGCCLKANPTVQIGESQEP